MESFNIAYKKGKKYIDATVWDDEKGWDFPKNHTHAHLFADILAKGVTRGYNTKVNEGAHGPLKDSYQLRTNFREVAEQVTIIDFYWQR